MYHNRSRYTRIDPYVAVLLSGRVAKRYTPSLTPNTKFRNVGVWTTVATRYKKELDNLL